MNVRDRVIELRRVRAGDLLPHPRNWRTHSAHQKRVWCGLRNELGFADALLVRELVDGRLQLVDGHLRARANPAALVPVLVLDLDEAEAEKLLLTHDPLGTLAGVDEKRLADLIARVEIDHDALQNLGCELQRPVADGALLPDIDLTPSYQVVVEVDGEDQQREVYERMRAAGYACRVLTLSGPLCGP